MTEYDNTNRGVLFKNKDKDSSHPNWADRQGSINVDGVDYWLSGWLKTAEKTGEQYMSLSVTKKEAFIQKNTQSRRDYVAEQEQGGYDDDGPF